MTNLIVFSHSCLRRVNRLVFEQMAKLSDFKIHIVAPKYLVSGSKQIPADSVESSDLCEVHFLTLSGDNPRNYWFIDSVELLEKLKPKIVHIDNDPLSLQARKLSNWTSKNSSKLTALTCENLSYYPIDNFKRRGFKGFLMASAKMMLTQVMKRKIDHVFTINKEGTALFLDYGYKSVEQIPLGFSPHIFYVDDKVRATKRKELGIDNYLTFAYIGRLIEEKGVHILLEALSKIKSNKDWVLLIDEFKDAQNTYQKEISELILRFNLKDRIKYFDADHTEIAKYMNAVDVVVIPSLSSPKWVEQYGRVAPEAMACGKLVVASKTGALIDLVADNGILFEEGNIDDLAKKLSLILENRDVLSSYKTKAINRAKTLNIESQAKEMNQAFKAIIL